MAKRRAGWTETVAKQGGQSGQGCFFSRKDWEAADAGLVTVNCPPLTTSGLVT